MEYINYILYYIIILSILIYISKLYNTTKKYNKLLSKNELLVMDIEYLKKEINELNIKYDNLYDRHEQCKKLLNMSEDLLKRK